jgi:hypothetical protein
MDYINAHNKAFISDLEAALGKIAAALEARESGADDGTPAGSAEELKAELPPLREALDEMDIQKSDQLMKQITAR